MIPTRPRSERHTAEATRLNAETAYHRREILSPGVRFDLRHRGKAEERILGGRVYRLDEEHPRANAEGYVPRAVLVAEAYLGRPLRPHEVIQHRNGDKSDDSPANLVIVRQRARNYD